MKNVTVLLTPGGGPGILAQLEALKTSTRYAARVLLADCNPASGNFFLPEVDARFRIPPCSAREFIEVMVGLIRREGITHWYSGLDEELPVIAANRSHIEAAGCRLVLPPLPGLKNALDKAATHRLLERRVRMPQTFFLDQDGNPDNIWDALEGKVLIKVTASRGGRHIYIPQDREEHALYMRRVRRIMQQTGARFMVQKRIEGDEYNVSSLHGIDGRVIYAVSRRKFETRQIKSTTTAAAIEKRADVIEQALAAVDGLGLKPGFNNVECIVSREEEQPYFIEINGGRTAAQDMNLVAAGINLTDLMIEIAEGGFPEARSHPADGTAILKIRKDVVVTIKEIAGVPEA